MKSVVLPTTIIKYDLLGFFHNQSMWYKALIMP